MARIRIGVGGWTFEPWRGEFYPDKLPQKRELDYASRHLTSIEINGTYYGSQKPASFIKWHDETPDDFVFALKGPRFTTNRRVLAEAGESVARFLASGVLELKDKLGPINWQFPTTKKFDAADFAAFLRLLPAQIDGRRIRHAVELRHESFVSPDAVAIARDHNVAIVLAGDSDFPMIADPTADFVYARIMGTDEQHAKGYAPGAIAAWIERARAFAAGGMPDDLAPIGMPAKMAPRAVFLYVISGHKPRNPAAAMELIAALEKD